MINADNIAQARLLAYVAGVLILACVIILILFRKEPKSTWHNIVRATLIPYEARVVNIGAVSRANHPAQFQYTVSIQNGNQFTICTDCEMPIRIGDTVHIHVTSYYNMRYQMVEQTVIFIQEKSDYDS